MRLELSYRPPLPWEPLLAFLSMRAIPGVERVRDGRYARTFSLGGARGVLEVWPLEEGRLALDVEDGAAGSAPEIARRLRRLLDLDADIPAIEEALRADSHLAPLIAARPGLRTPGSFDGFELAIRAILGQQISVTAAIRLAGILAAELGERLEGAGEGLGLAFPTPAAVAASDLTFLGMPGARRRSLIALAAAVRDDPSVLDDAARFQGLPGVGDWTAQYIALRHLRDPDAFPASDIGLMRALADGGARPGPRELLARAERWRPYRAYAAQHLWTQDAL